MCRNIKYFYFIFIYMYMYIVNVFIFLFFIFLCILVLFGFVWLRVVGFDGVSFVDGILGVVFREFVW